MELLLVIIAAVVINFGGYPAERTVVRARPVCDLTSAPYRAHMIVQTQGELGERVAAAERTYCSSSTFSVRQVAECRTCNWEDIEKQQLMYFPGKAE